MDYVLITKIILILLYSTFTIIRIHYTRKARKMKQESKIKESKLRITLLQFYIASTVVIFFFYLIKPEWFSWGSIPNYPNALIWVGMIIGVFSMVLFVYVHMHLGKYFSYTLKIYKDHKFITTGPYRFIRHPMYTAFTIFHSAIFLLTSNWFIGIIWVGIILLILVFRIRIEEKVLFETFGNEYKEYKQITGSLLPPIFKLLNGKNRKLILNSSKERDVKEA